MTTVPLIPPLDLRLASLPLTYQYYHESHDRQDPRSLPNQPSPRFNPGIDQLPLPSSAPATITSFPALSPPFELVSPENKPSPKAQYWEPATRRDFAYPCPLPEDWYNYNYPAMVQTPKAKDEDKRRQREINKARRHVCPVCDKRFNRPSSLNTHMSVHTGAKPYQCQREGCGRRFSVSSNLRRHERTHEQRGRPKSQPPRPMPYAPQYYHPHAVHASQHPQHASHQQAHQQAHQHQHAHQVHPAHPSHSSHPHGTHGPPAHANYTFPQQFEYTLPPAPGLRDYAVVGRRDGYYLRDAQASPSPAQIKPKTEPEF